MASTTLFRPLAGLPGRLVFLWLWLAMPLATHAQGGHVYKIQVLDAGNGHPLPFFLLKDEGTNRYEQGNAEGLLELQYATAEPRPAQVSLLGYVTTNVRLVPGLNSVKLPVQTLDMGEVQLTATNPRTLIDQANARVAQNYNLVEPRQYVLMSHSINKDQLGRKVEMAAQYHALVDLAKASAEVRLEHLDLLSNINVVKDDDFLFVPVQDDQPQSALFAVHKEKGFKQPVVFNPAGYQLQVDSVIAAKPHKLYVVTATPPQKAGEPHTLYTLFIEDSTYGVMRFSRLTTSQPISTRQQRNRLQSGELTAPGQFTDLATAEYHRQADGYLYPALFTVFGTYPKGECPLPDLLVCYTEIRHTLQQVLPAPKTLPGRRVSRKPLNKTQLTQLLKEVP